jgi:hypothetical protein
MQAPAGMQNLPNDRPPAEKRELLIVQRSQRHDLGDSSRDREVFDPATALRAPDR